MSAELQTIIQELKKAREDVDVKSLAKKAADDALNEYIEKYKAEHAEVYSEYAQAVETEAEIDIKILEMAMELYAETKER